MANFIEQMTAEYNPVNRNAKLQTIMEKWSRTGLLKKLDDNKSQVVAQLLENQALELRNQMLTEETQTGNVAGYNKIAFPLVRRVFGQLLASELVAVQPMSLPSGLLFFLDFKYDRMKSGSATAGGSVGRPRSSRMFGIRCLRSRGYAAGVVQDWHPLRRTQRHRQWPTTPGHRPG